MLTLPKEQYPRIRIETEEETPYWKEVARTAFRPSYVQIRMYVGSLAVTLSWSRYNSRSDHPDTCDICGEEILPPFVVFVWMEPFYMRDEGGRSADMHAWHLFPWIGRD